MHNLHLFDEFFMLYHEEIKPIVKLDEYLDWLNSLDSDYKRFFALLGFDCGKQNNAFAWFCLENRDWQLSDFIAYSEPD